MTPPTEEQIRDIYALAKRSWETVRPDVEFIPFEVWREELGENGLAALAIFVRLARYGVN